MSETTDLPEVIYTPESQLRYPLKLLASMWRDIITSRELAWRLLVRNISAKYRQTILGYTWIFLPAIFTTLTFVYLNSQKIFSIEKTDIPYPVFVLIGTLLWQLFVDSLNSPLQMVNQSKNMLTKINFPREALIIAGVGEVFFNFSIRLVLLFPIFYWFNITLPHTFFFAPIGFFALISLGITLGLLLVPIGLLYHDVTNGLRFIISIWFFLTPVVYPLPKTGIAKLLSTMNPVTPLLDTTRDLLTIGMPTKITEFWAIFLIAFILLFLSWTLYRLALPHLIARMSA